MTHRAAEYAKILREMRLEMRVQHDAHESWLEALEFAINCVEAQIRPDESRIGIYLNVLTQLRLLREGPDVDESLVQAMHALRRLSPESLGYEDVRELIFFLDREDASHDYGERIVDAILRHHKSVNAVMVRNRVIELLKKLKKALEDMYK